MTDDGEREAHDQTALRGFHGILATDHPERRIVRTGNTLTQAPTQRVDRRLEVRPGQLMTELQGKDADA